MSEETRSHLLILYLLMILLMVLVAAQHVRILELESPAYGPESSRTDPSPESSKEGIHGRNAPVVPLRVRDDGQNDAPNGRKAAPKKRSVKKL
jgi:hypothetical protein